MLKLPGFLLDDTATMMEVDVRAGFVLAEYFLLRRIFSPRGQIMPTARAAYISAAGVR